MQSLLDALDIFSEDELDMDVEYNVGSPSSLTQPSVGCDSFLIIRNVWTLTDGVFSERSVDVNHRGRNICHQ
jgi:hypothetical protein